MMVMAEIVNAIYVCVRDGVCVYDHGWNHECNSGLNAIVSVLIMLRSRVC